MAAASPPASEHGEVKPKHARRERQDAPPGAAATGQSRRDVETGASSGSGGRTRRKAVQPSPKNGTQDGRGTRRGRLGYTHERSARPVHGRIARGARSGDRPSPGTEERTGQTGPPSARWASFSLEREGKSDACDSLSQSQDTSCVTPVLRGPQKRHIHRDRSGRWWGAGPEGVGASAAALRPETRVRRSVFHASTRF